MDAKKDFKNNQTSPNRLKIKIFESYLTGVLIIDERIQKYSASDYIDIPNSQIFKTINCLIPNIKKVHLGDKNFGKKEKSLILNFIDENIKNVKFFIIHYGILERIFNSESERDKVIREKLSTWAMFTRVIVTSGRGKHSLSLPDDVCYINLSPLSNVFIENRSKYSINNLLNQARR